jgi:hypothetical protein
MTGPRIIETQEEAFAHEAAAAGQRARERARTEGATGARYTPDGWIAIRNGRLVGGPHRGTRGFLQASREAGTTEVIR